MIWHAVEMASHPGSLPGPTCPPRAGESWAGLPVAAGADDRPWPAWVVLSAERPAKTLAPPNPKRLLVQLLVATLAVLAVAGLSGVFASRNFAREDAIRDGRKTADLLAEAVVLPALTDGVLTGDAQARQQLDIAVRRGVLPHDIVRVKLWNPQGRILYSDEPRLVGNTHAFDREKQRAMNSGKTVAVISTGSQANASEHLLERGTNADLLEVYRPLTTPNGSRVLLEMYGDYSAVQHREQSLLRVMLIVVGTILAVIILLLAPVLWGLVRRLQGAAALRERLLDAAIKAADEERKRIAGTVHDGPVQELAGSALIVRQAGDRAARAGQPEIAGQIREAATTVRSSIASLRSLMVDIYPPKLSGSSLLTVLDDLAETLRSRGATVTLNRPDHQVSIGDSEALLIYRVVRECLQNVRKHADARNVEITVGRGRHKSLVVDVIDDGVGFDVAEVSDKAADGHLGLSVVADLSAEANAELAVRSAPGLGTWWRITIPVHEDR